MSSANAPKCWRNAAAFGAQAVLFDAATCDPLYRKAIRVSVGASLVVPYAQYVNPIDLLALLRERGFESWALTPADDAVDIRSLRSSEPRRIALWLGTEGAGLTAQVLTAAERRVQIAIEPDFDSLNVAATAGIALHELRR